MTIDPPQPLQGGLFSLNHGMFHPRNGPLRIEPKYDGFRCLITRHGAYARSGRKLPQARIFEPLMDYLPEEAKWFDCELLGTRTRGQNIALVVFDVAMPGELHERLDHLYNLQEAPVSTELKTEVYRAPDLEFPLRGWDEARAGGMEGIVVKRLESTYGKGLIRDWVKYRYAFPGNEEIKGV